MKRLSEIVKNPSGFDSLNNYMGSIPEPEWYCLVTRNRDSDILTESNFECALERLGGEAEGEVEIFRFGHWACGYWEALAVKQGTKQFSEAEKIEQELDNYPVLDEGDFFERERVEADRIWVDCYDFRERVKYIREHKSQFEFHDFSDLLACARGKYFAGYAGELIS